MEPVRVKRHYLIEIEAEDWDEKRALEMLEKVAKKVRETHILESRKDGLFAGSVIDIRPMVG